MSRAQRPPDRLEVIGRRLRSTRQSLELRTIDMCAEINVQSNTYSQWESGARLLDVFAAIRMAERFGLTLDWLFRGDASALPHGIAIKVLMAESDEITGPDLFKNPARRPREGLMLMDRGQVPLDPPGKKSPRGNKPPRGDGKPPRRR